MADVLAPTGGGGDAVATRRRRVVLVSFKLFGQGQV